MKPIFFVLTFLLVLGACSTDVFVDPLPLTETRSGTCFDGILNGPEVIVDCGGDCPGFCPPNSIGILGGEVRGVPLDQEQVAPLQLDPELEYRLIGPLLIRDGARLSIPAGTVIKVDPNVGAYIAVAQGGSLLVSGQPDKPVIITSGAENPAPGDWGGIIICGQGPIYTGEVDRTDIIDIFYGGPNVEDSSGGINYLRVEFAGALSETGQNFDAISFYGVGSFTSITNIQTYNSLGNGVRFIGGNADARQLIATNSGANAIIVQDDWSGNGESWYMNGIGASGLTFSSSPTLESVLPVTTDTIVNVSIVGPAPEGGLSYAAGGGNYYLENVFTTDLGVGINVTDETAATKIGLGDLNIESIEFADPTPNFIPTNYSGVNSTFFREGITTGASNREVKPNWANGWTLGID